MARIFEDGFSTVTTGTLLSGDTPDTAGAGTWVGLIGNAIVDANDRVYNASSEDNVIYYVTDTPSDADYYVECVLYKHTDIDQDGGVGPLARYNDRTGTGGNAFNWYHAGYDDLNARVILTSVVNGVGTLIG